MTISPVGAVSAGAQWQVDGGPWQNSEATVGSLLAGNHTVTFSVTPGWGVPASQNVTVYLNQTTVATAAYLNPRPATVTATVLYGFVVYATITDGGVGYTNTPLVRIIGGGGSGAQAVATVSNGVVVAITILNAGFGYTNTPLVVIAPPFVPQTTMGIAAMSCLNFTNLTVGSNYQFQSLQDGTWSNLAPVLTATNSNFSQIVAGVVDGSDYRLALTPIPNQAYATVQVVYGFVVLANVTAGGSGYVAAPTVSILDSTGSNATAVAYVSGGVVTNVTITGAGFGYSTTPSVIIAPPPVIAVTPTVLPVMELDLANLSPYDNYQLQFTPDIGEAWNSMGGVFSPTDVTNTQYVFVTNSVGFFRLQYLGTP